MAGHASHGSYDRFGGAGTAPESGAPVSIGSYRMLHSEVLGEDRTVLVHLPEGYSTTTASYPVVYMLYGDHVTTYFARAVSELDTLGSGGRIPECILIGIMNTDRYRDLLPEVQGKPTGIDGFIRFLDTELFPWVETELRTKPFRVLVGPQAGGNFGLYTLLKRPGLFDAYPFPDDLEVASLADVLGHYRALTTRYGYPVDPPERVLGRQSHRLMERGETDAAVEVRRATAWVDTGNQYLIVVEGLARDLGLDDSLLGDAESEHSVESTSPAPAMSIGGVALTAEGIEVRVRSGTWVQNGVPAEMFLPASALRNLHIVFDGPGRQMTLAPPGVLTPRGEPVPCRVNRETGLVMIEATVAGEPVPLGVDTGSAGTWVSRVVAEGWPDRYPDLAWAVGAAGSANFFGLPFEAQGALTSLPEIGIGGIRVPDVAVLALGQDLFDWHSEKSASAVSGFIGGNVIDRCRLEIDWQGGMTWRELGPVPAERDLDIVGLTLRPVSD